MRKFIRKKVTTGEVRLFSELCTGAGDFARVLAMHMSPGMDCNRFRRKTLPQHSIPYTTRSLLSLIAFVSLILQRLINALNNNVES